MSDVLALGYGTVAGTRASPQTLLTAPPRYNFVTVRNNDATNWLFVKDATDPGPFCLALPGQAATIAMGPTSANNMTKLVGFATTPSEAATITLTAALEAKKIA